MHNLRKFMVMIMAFAGNVFWGSKGRVNGNVLDEGLDCELIKENTNKSC